MYIKFSNEAPSFSHSSPTCFAIQAEVEPGVLPRILEQFAKRNLVPNWLESVCDGTKMSVRLTCDIADEDDRRRLILALNGIIGVTSVFLTVAEPEMVSL